MHERLLDDWLTKVDERGLETPFCHLLSGQGYTVVHLSRHGDHEQGKDVLALDRDGTPSAFQLKAPQGTKLTLRQWGDIVPQIVRLVELPVEHPSIPTSVLHRAVLVVNGELDEAVRTEIGSRNRDWDIRGRPQLEVWTRGQLRRDLLSLGSDLWPTGIEDMRKMLELFTADGAEFLPKEQLCRFVEGLALGSQDLTDRVASRIMPALGMIVSYALTPFTSRANHWAVMEGWAVYLASISAMAVRDQLRDAVWSSSLEIAGAAIGQALRGMVRELMERRDLFEGSTLFEGEFCRFRTTILAGACALATLWSPEDASLAGEREFVTEFVREHFEEMGFWGEGCVPHFLACHWALRRAGNLTQSDRIIDRLVYMLSSRQFRAECGGVPSPYVPPGQVVEERSGLGAPSVLSSLRDRLDGESYWLESLVQLNVRHARRAALEARWREITHTRYCRFIPEAPWQWFSWRCPRGVLEMSEPTHTQSWQQLRASAEEPGAAWLPDPLNRRPHLLLLLLMVYPHRVCPGVVRALDNAYAIA